MSSDRGCKCKRCKCTKGYCECYVANRPCSDNCKCVGCGNVALDENAAASAPINNSEQKSDKKTDTGTPTTAAASAAINNTQQTSDKKTDTGTPTTAAASAPIYNTHQYLTEEVIDAAVQCMINQAAECERSGLQPYQIENMVILELGRCLMEIAIIIEEEYDKQN